MVCSATEGQGYRFTVVNGLATGYVQCWPIWYWRNFVVNMWLNDHLSRQKKKNCHEVHQAILVRHILVPKLATETYIGRLFGWKSCIENILLCIWKSMICLYLPMEWTPLLNSVGECRTSCSVLSTKTYGT